MSCSCSAICADCSHQAAVVPDNGVPEESTSPASTINKIAQAVGGLGAFNNLPQLTYEPGFTQGTYYADGVSSEKMSDPIMRIVDPSTREFKALAIKTVSQSLEEQPSKDKVSVEVWFQRYSNDKDEWACGHHNGTYPLAEGRVTALAIQRLRQVVQGQTIRMYDCLTGNNSRVVSLAK